VEHIRGHLWHRYSTTVNQVIKIVSVMCTTICYSNWTPDCAEIDISHLSQFPGAKKIGLIKYNSRKLWKTHGNKEQLMERSNIFLLTGVHFSSKSMHIIKV
jgi:hypothetical protein